MWNVAGTHRGTSALYCLAEHQPFIFYLFFFLVVLAEKYCGCVCWTLHTVLVVPTWPCDCVWYQNQLTVAWRVSVIVRFVRLRTNTNILSKNKPSGFVYNKRISLSWSSDVWFAWVASSAALVSQDMEVVQRLDFDVDAYNPGWRSWPAPGPSLPL